MFDKLLLLSFVCLGKRPFGHSPPAAAMKVFYDLEDEYYKYETNCIEVNEMPNDSPITIQSIAKAVYSNDQRLPPQDSFYLEVFKCRDGSGDDSKEVAPAEDWEMSWGGGTKEEPLKIVVQKKPPFLAGKNLDGEQNVAWRFFSLLALRFL